MLRMSRMKDLSVRHPARVEDHLAIQAGHLAHLRVFPKGPVVSPVVIRLVVSPVEAFMEAEAVLVASTVGVSPVEVGASMVGVAAVDNRMGCRDCKFCEKEDRLILFFLSWPLTSPARAIIDGNL